MIQRDKTYLYTSIAIIIFVNIGCKSIVQNIDPKWVEGKTIFRDLNCVTCHNSEEGSSILSLYLKELDYPLKKNDIILFRKIMNDDNHKSKGVTATSLTEEEIQNIHFFILNPEDVIDVP